MPVLRIGFLDRILVPQMSRREQSVKDLILELIRAMPENHSYDEILRELAFVRMVDRGLEDAGKGRTIDTDELRQRVRRWQR